MSEVSKAYVTLLTRMPGVQRDIQTQLEQGVAGAEKSTGSRFAGALGTVAKTGALALAAVGIAGAKAGIETAAGMEQARISFTTMLGSAQKADTFLKSLADFAAKTPFEFPELQAAASSLVSAGFQADKIIPIMRTLGDVTSGMGTGSEGVKRATIALQQMSAAGKITGEDLNQLRDAGVPVFDLLSAATGKSKEAIADLAAKGKLGKKEMDQLFAALESGKGLERFAGLMDKQSQSLTGMWSTFTDTLNVGLAQAIEPLIPLLKDGLGGAARFLAEWLPKVGTGISGIVTWFQGLGQSTIPVTSSLSGIGSAFQGIVTAVTNMWNTVAPIVQQFVSGMTERLAPMAPQVKEIFATVGGIVTSVMDLISTVITQVTSAIKVVWDNWGEGIMNVISRAWETVTGVIGGALNVIQGIIKTVTALIKGDWSEAWEGIKQVLSGAWQAITSAVSGGIQTLFEMVKGIPGKVMEGIGNLKDLLFEKGSDIVAGMIAGIESMAGRLAEFVRQFVVEHIPGPVRKALGIDSPSRVMADQAKWIPLGIVKGIESQAGRVDDAMRSLVRVPTMGSPSMSVTIPDDGWSISGMIDIGGVLAPLVDGRISRALDGAARERRYGAA